MADRLSVLLVAEAANPDWVSVPLVGWSLAHALSDVVDTHLVTQVRNHAAIEKQGYVEGRDFTAIDTEAVAALTHRLGGALSMGKSWTVKTAISSMSYPYFERKVWQRFGADISDGRFDVVHRITPLTPTANSSLAAKCKSAGVPFVVGPLNGGVPWPAGFDRERRREREYLSYIRNAYKLVPGRQRMFANCAAIIAGSRHTQSEIPCAVSDRTIWLPENAFWPERFHKRATPGEGRPLRGCFIGRCVPYKGPDMLLEAALPLLRLGGLKLDIIGDGPLLNTLKEFVRANDIGGMVDFHGHVPHENVQDIAAQADLLTFPSIREFGGGVVLEAMALGVVPLIVDYAGPGELVSTGSGLKVPLGSRASIIDGFRAALEDLVADPSPLPELSANARRKALTHFTWPAKAQQVAEVYKWVTKRRPDKPVFDFD